MNSPDIFDSVSLYDPGRVRLDYVLRGDGNPVYRGKNTQTALDSDPNWVIQRFTYDLTGNVTDIQILMGAWSSRASLPWV